MLLKPPNVLNMEMLRQIFSFTFIIRRISGTSSATASRTRQFAMFDELYLAPQKHKKMLHKQLNTAVQNAIRAISAFCIKTHSHRTTEEPKGEPPFWLQAVFFKMAGKFSDPDL